MNFDILPRFNQFQIPIVEKIPQWADLFEVDRLEIERQIALAHGWADNNKKKAPKKNIMRYLYNWMMIAQRKGSLVKKRIPAAARPADPEADMTIEEMRAIRQKNFPQYKPDPCKFTNVVDTEVIHDAH